MIQLAQDKNKYFLGKCVEKDWFIFVLWFESEVYRKSLDDLAEPARDNLGLGWRLEFHDGRRDIFDDIRVIPRSNHFLTLCRNELKLTLICTVDLVMLIEAELSLYQELCDGAGSLPI